MNKLHILFYILIISIFILAFSKDNKIKSDSHQVIEKNDTGKIKTELVYEITKPSKEYMIEKTEYNPDGKKTKSTTFFEDGKESSLTNYIYDDKGILVKENVKWANFDDGYSNYTIIYKYDEKGRLFSEKYEGDYATDVSPDLFEYIYGDGDKPIEKLHYVTVIPEKPKDLQFKETYKYDSKGNKIEEIMKGISFDYLSKITYEYDDNNKIIKEIDTDMDGKISNIIYEYNDNNKIIKLTNTKSDGKISKFRYAYEYY